jgi:superfamily II DNA or RNA helicase
MILRPYQVEAVARLRAAIAAGTRRLVLCCPTGGGKTVIAAHIIRGAVARGKRVVVIAHRKELIDQTVDKLARFGVEAGVVMANDSRRDDYHPTQVCTIQTISRRLDRMPPADLVIYDEVHHAAARSSRAVLDCYHGSVVVGLTATPWRSDRLGLGDLFGGIVLARTPGELMASGDLVGYDAFAYDAPELHEVGIVAGEYNQRDLGLACNTKILVGGVVREYITHAAGRRAICFPVSIAHSRAIVAEFQSTGIAAEHLDCHTPKRERAAILEGLATGALRVVSSVGVLTEGFDCPAAEVAILARPTKSLGLHLQMIGRVLRPADGKTSALIHDHAGNMLRHGCPDDPREYSLERSPDRVIERCTCPYCKAIIVTAKRDGTCPACGELIVADADTCQTCGKSKSPYAEPDAACTCERIGRSDGPAIVDGQRIDLNEIRRRRAALGIDREMRDSDLLRVAAATREDKAREYLRLVAVATGKGFKPGFVSHQYRAVFGVWPRFADGELDGVDAGSCPFIPLPRR